MPSGGKRSGAGRKKKLSEELQHLIGAECENRWLGATRDRVSQKLSARIDELVGEAWRDINQMRDGWGPDAEGTKEIRDEVEFALDEIRDQGQLRDVRVRTPKVGRDAVIKEVTDHFNTLWRVTGVDMQVTASLVDRCWKAFRANKRNKAQ